ncbi:hypothetical protein [Dickeya oryzae]
MAHDFPPGKSGSSRNGVPALFAKSISQMIPALSVCSEQYDDGAALFFNVWQENKIIETERPRLKKYRSCIPKYIREKGRRFLHGDLIFCIKNQWIKFVCFVFHICIQ